MLYDHDKRCIIKCKCKYIWMFQASFVISIAIQILFVIGTHFPAD